jgi:hypothetical protein
MTGYKTCIVCNRLKKDDKFYKHLDKCTKCYIPEENGEVYRELKDEIDEIYAAQKI